MKTLIRMTLLMLGLALTLTGTVFVTPSYACEGGITVIERDSRGEIIQTVRCPEGEGAGQDGSGRTEKRACNSPNGDVIPCTSDLGWWNGARGCYARVSENQHAIPVDPTISADFILMQCTRLSGLQDYYLVPRTEPEPPDPRVLAQTAISRMGLEPIRIGAYPHTTNRSPMSLGVVGRNVWMWVDAPSGSTFGPITKSASAGGYTVVATARVAEVVWDMGDGTVVSCGRGTAFRASTDDDPASPDCGHVYTRDGHYTLTATSHWEITWSGIGQSGTIPMELSVSEQLSIAEIQVVNVPVDQN